MPDKKNPKPLFLFVQIRGSPRPTLKAMPNKFDDEISQLKIKKKAKKKIRRSK